MLGMPLQVYGFALAVAAAVPLLWWSVASADPVIARVRSNLGEPTTNTPVDVRKAVLAESARARLVAPLIGRAARTARRLAPSSFIETLEQRLALAGELGVKSVEQVLAQKTIFAIGGSLLALLFWAQHASAGGALMALLIPVVAFNAPDFSVRRKGEARQATILRELPDTLDEITISVEAGLGFEAAMAEAGRSGNGPMADELVRTLQDIQIGVPRSEALAQLVWRTDVPDLRHFVVAVRQAEQYGVPIAQVLRVQSKEMRERRRQRAEERAMKMPVKILVPTIFFILPALFIVLLGPAAFRLVDALGH